MLKRTYVMVVSGLVWGALASAGPITPPPGPVTSTLKTLSEVEPRIAINSTNTPGDADSVYKITQRGSYYLTASAVVPINRIAIEVAAGGVDIDMNGFGFTSFSALPVIQVTLANGTNVSVRNGTINGTAGPGIDLSLVSGASVSDVRVSGCVGTGIHVGPNSIVRDCTAIDGGSDGIRTEDQSLVRDCTAGNNGGEGFAIGSGSTIMHCTGASNDVGIHALTGSTITECTVYQNASYGILAETGCMVSGCTAALNSGIGISAISACTISGCTTRSNTLDGIRVGNDCLVVGNNCSYDGAGTGSGAGVHATGANNRIEGNKCLGADRGIDVDASGNIIIRNTCSNNTTNWTIIGGNAYGPIVVTPSGAAVSGNSAAASLGSTDPNANFTY